MMYGCIGEKLGHSFSAEIHRQLFDYDYQLMEIPREGLQSFMEQRAFKAINVTIPYKEMVLPYLDEIDDIAAGIGAVNTVVNRNGRLYGYNTDFAGLCALLEKAGIFLKDKKVLVLGSGGTSKTAQAVARHQGCRSVYRVSRSGRDGCITYAEATTAHRDAQILINTTPCGMFPNIDGTAVDIQNFPALEGVADAVYNPLRSKLVCNAQCAGIPAVGGLYMLVAQAAFAAEKFTDQTVPVSKVDAVYRRLLTEKQNVVLIGMPGCGKSTVGKRLAEELQADFVDTDLEIEREYGLPPAKILEQAGEAAFRDMESAVIRRLAVRQHTVIATGGGAILRQENVQWLRANGRLYFIDRSLEQLMPTEDRPLSKDRDALEQRYRERYSIYCACCDKHIHSDNIFENTVRSIRRDFLHEDFGD